MVDIVSHDSAFNRLIIGHAKVEHLWTGGRWLEGPAYFPAGRYLVFSDIPNNRLMRFDETDSSVSVFRAPSNHANGNTTDRMGRLITCEHLSRAVTRTEFDGSVRILADRCEGRRLNSPNDVVVKSDGTVWFTDPTYGIDGEYEGDRAPSETGGSFVYRLDPEHGTITTVIRDRVQPNGLAFSPDEAVLYVGDTGASHQPGLPVTIHAYPVSGGSGIGKPELFATCRNGFYDGFRLDVAGNLWTSAGTDVHCYAPGGALIGEIRIGEIVGNLCFGGQKRNRLYICAQTSLYSYFVNTRGAV
ncbi:MAG: SMP-30/gluconolactonase/LRE family protein [Proteobacteria bacterium]|nr:SMP-30/gluconolactonase/LRE family protein [Pseudomonadota bacterium]